MMHLLGKYDVAPVGRNDAMFAIMCRQAHIIRRSRHHSESGIICLRQTSLKKASFRMLFSGAGGVTRTRDLLITNQLHYRLCYTSIAHRL